MTLNVRSSAAWSSKTDLRKRVSGAWVAATVAYKRVSGAWVAFLTAALTPISKSATGSTSARVTLTASAAGTYIAYSNINGGANTDTSSYSWDPASSGYDYDVMLTVSSGAVNDASAATGTWIAFSSSGGVDSVTWMVTANSTLGNNKSVTGTLQFRLRSTGAVVGTAAISMSANY